MNQYHIGAGPYSTSEAIRFAVVAAPPTTTTAGTTVVVLNSQFKANLHVRRFVQPTMPLRAGLIHQMKYAAEVHG
jgi:hypothetical protein